ncbi:nucleoside hydrolase [Cryobacterium soli]|uniref:nucleoside hydrolase n=1 Tax=Cryobacterium soli TaxID=2220095 RepID=UPI0013C4C950|nr:nucleoside hydrolase [Cryobacterium soli]
MPARVIIDTDFHMDVDDVGALAVAHALADRGDLNVLAVMLNTPSEWGAPAIDIVNRWAGRRLPIGVLPQTNDAVPDPEYAMALVARFGAAVDLPTEPAVALYRRLLSQAEPASLTLVSIGFFDNLMALLDSEADDIAPQTGRELIRLAVRRTVVMGGVFPQGREFNFVGHVALTHRFLEDWPVSVDFVGFEVAAGLITGSDLSSVLGPNHPVAFAYATYNSGEGGRDSWDPLTVLVASETETYVWSEPCRVSIDADGVDTFEFTAVGPHRIMLPLSDPATTSAKIDDLLASSRSSSLGYGGHL